jgi:hypothetical protein
MERNMVKEIEGISLTGSSFPVAMENYGENVKSETESLVKQAQSGNLEDIYALGAKTFALATSLYLYTIPTAITTRQNAFKLIYHAAQQGHEQAMIHAAVLLITGEGTPQDTGEALWLFNQLAQSGKDPALKNLAVENAARLKKEIAAGTLPPPVKAILYSLSDDGQPKIIEEYTEGVSDDKAFKNAAVPQGVIIFKPLNLNKPKTP